MYLDAAFIKSSEKKEKLWLHFAEFGKMICNRSWIGEWIRRSRWSFPRSIRMRFHGDKDKNLFTINSFRFE